LKNFEEKLDLTEEKVSRRGYVKYVGGVVVVAAVAAGGYGIYEATKPSPTTPTPTTPTPTPTPTPSPTPTPTTKIGCSVPSYGAEYYYLVAFGGQEFAAQIGFESRVLTNEWDAQKNVSDVEALAAAGCKILYFVVIDQSTTSPVTHAAVTGKAYFTSIWNIQPGETPYEVGDYYVNFNTPDSMTDAREIGMVLFSKLAGKGKVAQITGPPGQITNEMINMGCADAHKKFPGIEVVRGAPTWWNRDQAMKSMEDLLTAHPKIDGLYGNCDSIGIGMSIVAERRGLGLLPMVGINAISEAMKAIKEGRQLVSAANMPSWQGGFSAVRSYDGWRGYKFKDEDRMSYSPSLLVGKDVNELERLYPDHVEAFMAEEPLFEEIWGSGYAKRGGRLPWNWKKMSVVLAEEEGFEVDYSGGFIKWDIRPIPAKEFMDLVSSILGI